MNVILYDLILLGVFLFFVLLFLYVKRKKLKKDGLLILYRTKLGIKIIDRVGKKYKKTLKFLSYVSITIGYLLMGAMVYLFGKIVYMYIAYPNIVRAVKVPPIMPLVPYLPRAFNLNFLPPFYFIYWIIILAIVAIFHEFAHGIFMRRYDIKIKSTGFGFFPFFLPIFLAAFVEQDEKSMEKTSRFKQKAVLSAGTFANLITAIVTFGIMVLFFTLAFTPSGVQFDNYAYTVIGLGGITSINNISVNNPTYDRVLELTNENLTRINTINGKYLLTKKFLNTQQNKKNYILAYLDSPAIKSNLKGGISKINDQKIDSLKDLDDALNKYSPGDTINLKTNLGNYQVKLGESPLNKSKAWLGILFNNKQKGIINFFSSFKKQNVHYESKIFGGQFIYDFLWWLVLISFSVALINMLPMGIFDGGRFFYLTILGLTKSKKRAEQWFKGVTRFLLFLVLLLMIFWAISFI